MFTATRMGLMVGKGVVEPEIGPPSVIATASYTSPASAANHTIAMPASVQPGDLLLVFFATGGSTAPTTSSSGWSYVTEQATSSPSILTLYKKTATGTDSLVVSMSSSRYATAVIYVVRNASTCRTSSYTGLASGTAASVPTVTLLESKPFICIPTVMVYTDRTATAAPTNYTNLLSTDSNNSMGVFGAQRSGLTGTSESPGPFTVSASGIRYGSITIAAYQA